MGALTPFLLLLLANFVTLGESTITLNEVKESTDVGVTVSIICTISGGDTYIGWYRNNKEVLKLRNNERVHYTKSADRYTLKIQNIVISDGGVYECRGSGGKLDFRLSVQHIEINATQYLRLDQTVKIKVSIAGNPRPRVEWKFGNGTIIKITNSRYQLLSDGSLQISRMVIGDKGTYICEVTQTIISKPYPVKVIPFRPAVILQPPLPERRYVTKGYNTTFVCIADGYPKPTVQWFNPIGREVNTFDTRKMIIGNTFYILNVEKSDKGNWTCKASIGDEAVYASSMIVDVYEPPELYEPPFPWVYYPELFKEYTIGCKARGYPTPTVVIRKSGRISPRMDIRPGAAFVRFFLVREHDLGNYSCEAWSGARDSEGNTIVVNQTFAVFTKDKPVINPSGSPSVIYSYVGNPKPLRINCDFVSYPLANVTIWRGFYELTNGTDQATLYVWTYSWEDFGPYSCIGSNIYGEVNYTVWIKHATPPSKPQEIKSNITCDRASFSWNPPNNTGGMEIDQYVIEDRGQLYNTNDSYPEWRIWDLEPNKEYTITFRGRNRQGPGASATVTFRTNETCLPDRPIVFSPVARVLDRTFLDLRWRKPENVKDSTGMWYKIVVKEAEDVEEIGHIKVYSSMKYDQRIGGLRKNITYRFELRAIDSIEQESSPTFVYYDVAPNAMDSAHALLASVWSILLATVITALGMRS